MRIALLGFGLIGGSIARAVRRSRGGFSIAAWSPSGAGPRAALAAGVVDAAPREPAAALAGAELVVLAAPPLDCLALLDQLAGPWCDALAPGTTITDVASTKGAIMARADALGLSFVGGHPMAGRETSGFGAATAELFVDRPWVIVPGRAAGEADLGRVALLARACGARPLRLTAAEHDAATAAVSHLPLVLAAALVEAVAGGIDQRPDPAWPLARNLAAGAWRDMTRIARGDPAMAAGIAATNAAELAARLRVVVDVLERWRLALEAPGGPDPIALLAAFAAVRERLGGVPPEGDGSAGRGAAEGGPGER